MRRVSVALYRMELLPGRGNEALKAAAPNKLSQGHVDRCALRADVCQPTHFVKELLIDVDQHLGHGAAPP